MLRSGALLRGMFDADIFFAVSLLMPLFAFRRCYATRASMSQAFLSSLSLSLFTRRCFA